MAALPARTSQLRLVNSQVTDAITQTSAQVLGEAPAMAMASLYQIASQSAGLLLQNNASSQHAMNQLNMAVVSTSVSALMSMATAEDAKSSDKNKKTNAG